MSDGEKIQNQQFQRGLINMTKVNGVEDKIKEAGLAYLLACYGHGVGPKEMYQAYYQELKGMALLLHATTKSRIYEIEDEVRKKAKKRYEIS